jgi:hypothetical protein
LAELCSHFIYRVVGAGAVRTFYIGRLMGPEYDKMLDCFAAYAAAVAETNVAVVCACAPSLKSFSRHLISTLTSKNSSSRRTDPTDLGERDIGFKKGEDHLRFLSMHC